VEGAEVVALPIRSARVLEVRDDVTNGVIAGSVLSDQLSDLEAVNGVVIEDLDAVGVGEHLIGGRLGKTGSDHSK